MSFVFIIIAFVATFLIIVSTVFVIMAKTQNKPSHSTTGSNESSNSRATSIYAQDTVQKNEVMNIVASINEYTSNHYGSLPATNDELQSAYDSSEGYTVTRKSVYSSADVPVDAQNLYYLDRYTCEAETVVAGTSRQFVILYRTSSGDIHCVSN